MCRQSDKLKQLIAKERVKMLPIATRLKLIRSALDNQGITLKDQNKLLGFTEKTVIPKRMKNEQINNILAVENILIRMHLLTAPIIP